MQTMILCWLVALAVLGFLAWATAERNPMIYARWFGLRCWLGGCPGTIDHEEDRGVRWRCSLCGRCDYANEQCWDELPEDGPAHGPRL